MSNNLTKPNPTWDDIKAASNELDQMASQTVLKACDVGDMLRRIRLTMEVKVWESALSETLGRTRQWANQLIILSFRRSAVLKALANGTANDSIRSAYEHVKALPPPEEEVYERDQWPKAKRGPITGSANAGRPRNSTPKPQGPKAVHWQILARELEGWNRSSDWINTHIRDRVEAAWGEQIPLADRNDPNRKQSAPIPGEKVASFIEALQKVHAEWLLEQEQIKSEKEGEDFTQKLDNKINEYKDLFNTKGEETALNKAIRAAERKVKIQFDQAVQKAVEEKVTPIYEKSSREIDYYQKFTDAYSGVLTYEEFKSLLGFVHPDRNPGREEKAATLYKMLLEKQEVLCGKKSEPLENKPGSLPSLQEILQRRNNNQH